MVQSARDGLLWIEQNGLWEEAEQQRQTIRDLTKQFNRDRCRETGIPNPCRI